MLIRSLLLTILLSSIFVSTTIFTKNNIAFATNSNPDTSNTSLNKNYNASLLLNHAIGLLGKHYRHRGSNPKSGFDCSGFVLYNFKRFNITLPHSSYEQIKFGEKIPIKNAKAGDLIFFKGRSLKSKAAGHVGIVISIKDNIVKFIHSSTSLGVRYDYTNARYYKLRFLEIRRL